LAALEVIFVVALAMADEAHDEANFESKFVMNGRLAMDRAPCWAALRAGG